MLQDHKITSSAQMCPHFLPCAFPPWGFDAAMSDLDNHAPGALRWQWLFNRMLLGDNRKCKQVIYLFGICLQVQWNS